jgi:AmiR/NasT family two-component response regulator
MSVGKSQRARENTVRSKIRNLRSLKAWLLHPQDSEGEELWQHLRRIGCQVETFWPPPKSIPKDIDVVFLALSPIVENDIHFPWKPDDESPVLIVIVDYENPVVIEKILELNARATIGRPVRPFGILANLLVSIINHDREQRLRYRIERLNSKIKAKREIERAKSILMGRHDLSEDEAYELIRKQAMNKRTTIESIASAILHTSDILRQP